MIVVSTEFKKSMCCSRRDTCSLYDTVTPKGPDNRISCIPKQQLNQWDCGRKLRGKVNRGIRREKKAPTVECKRYRAVFVLASRCDPNCPPSKPLTKVPYYRFEIKYLAEFVRIAEPECCTGNRLSQGRPNQDAHTRRLYFHRPKFSLTRAK
jgi:hypothetical protein